MTFDIHRWCFALEAIIIWISIYVCIHTYLFSSNTIIVYLCLEGKKPAVCLFRMPKQLLAYLGSKPKSELTAIPWRCSVDGPKVKAIWCCRCCCCQTMPYISTWMRMWLGMWMFVDVIKVFIAWFDMDQGQASFVWLPQQFNCAVANCSAYYLLMDTMAVESPICLRVTCRSHFFLWPLKKFSTHLGASPWLV